MFSLHSGQAFAERVVRHLGTPDETVLATLYAGDLAHELGFLDGMPRHASLVATSPGLRFFYDGQLEGRRLKAPVQLARWPDEQVDEPIRAMYDRILRFARAPLLHDGVWRLLHVTGAGDHTFNDVVAYRWRSSHALAVVVVNLGRSASQAHVYLGADLLDGDEFDFVDALTDARYRWTRESLVSAGLYVRLAAGGAHLFTVLAQS